LAQSEYQANVEVIVVDDGSTDETPKIVSQYGDKVRAYRFPKNCGRNSARNTGLGLSQGKYVKFLDSDDVLLPGTLIKEAAIAEKSTADIVIAGWREDTLDDDKNVVDWRAYSAPVMGNIIDDVLAGKAVPTSAALYRRDLVSNMQWDKALVELDDWDWFAMAALRARNIKTADHFSYIWRQHKSQGTRSYTMLSNAKAHHQILRKIELELSSLGELTSSRRLRLAQYYYKELRVLAFHDTELFKSALQHINDLDPDFLPRDEERQRWMRLACRVLGVRTAITLHCMLKRRLSHRPIES
jgi:glycosyltransferase involved in cell wall biosynthesis